MHLIDNTSAVKTMSQLNPVLETVYNINDNH